MTFNATFLNHRSAYLYGAARARLTAAGVPLREDGAAWRAYAELRTGWDAADERVRAYLGYPETRDHL